MYGDDDYLREAYQQIVDKQKSLVNEGLWDRTKAAASGMRKSLNNAPAVTGNVLKGAAAGAKGDVAGVQKAADANAYRTTGNQVRQERLKQIHDKKLKSLTDQFIKSFRNLAQDYEKDVKKSGIFDAQIVPQLKEAYLQDVAEYLQPLLDEIHGSNDQPSNDVFDGQDEAAPVEAAPTERPATITV